MERVWKILSDYASIQYQVPMYLFVSVVEIPENCSFMMEKKGRGTRRFVEEMNRVSITVFSFYEWETFQ